VPPSKQMPSYAPADWDTFKIKLIDKCKLKKPDTDLYNISRFIQIKTSLFYSENLKNEFFVTCENSNLINDSGTLKVFDLPLFNGTP